MNQPLGNQLDKHICYTYVQILQVKTLYIVLPMKDMRDKKAQLLQVIFGSNIFQCIIELEAYM